MSVWRGQRLFVLDLEPRVKGEAEFLDGLECPHVEMRSCSVLVTQLQAPSYVPSVDAEVDPDALIDGLESLEASADLRDAAAGAAAEGAFDGELQALHGPPWECADPRGRAVVACLLHAQGADRIPFPLALGVSYERRNRN